MKQEKGCGTWGEIERKFALAMAVARLTDMFTLQFTEASITFIIVRMVMTFLERRTWSRLSLGVLGKSVSDEEEAFMIMSWSRGGMVFHPDGSSFLSSSSSGLFKRSLSESARMVFRISLISEKALAWAPELTPLLVDKSAVCADCL